MLGLTKSMKMMSILKAVALSVVFLSAHSHAHGGLNQSALCKQDRFNAYNFSYLNADAIVEYPVGKGKQLATNDKGQLLRCPDGFTVELLDGNQVKCASKGDGFIRDWELAQVLKPGIDFESSILLQSCGTVIIKSYRF